MAYVALSRVTAPNGLYLLNLRNEAIKPDDAVLTENSRQISVWNRHIFVGDSICVTSCEHSVGSEIFVFLSKFYTPLPVPISRPIPSWNSGPFGPFHLQISSRMAASASAPLTWTPCGWSYFANFVKSGVRHFIKCNLPALLHTEPYRHCH